MEQKRWIPKKGEIYWFASLYSGEGMSSINNGSDFDQCHILIGDCFSTKEEADAMVNKFKAVLQGADVIEMPSEEDITDKIFSTTGEVVGPEGEITVFHCMKISKKVLEWIKSKIIK